MASEMYESLKHQLVEAMAAEDRAHIENIRPEKERVERMQRTRFDVELVVSKSERHVRGCEQCKAEGNAPLVRAPL